MIDLFILNKFIYFNVLDVLDYIFRWGCAFFGTELIDFYIVIQFLNLNWGEKQDTES